LESIQNGILYRRWDIEAVTPITERRRVLRVCHGIRSSGHRGIKKTIGGGGGVRQRLYWPGLQDDVRRYVSGCEQCLMVKN
jgi:hypothetical protein